MSDLILGGNIVMPKASGTGIKIDHTSPDWCWRDIIGEVNPKQGGAGSPTRTAFTANVYLYAFAINNFCDFSFHMPHDYVPGSHIYWHLHWAHNGSNISGTFETTNYITYAKGHNQANYSAEIAPLITYATVNLATTPSLRHRIDEIQLSATSPSATQIDSDDLEADGLIHVTTKATQLPTVTGGSLFITYGDIHYQSNNLGTKQKAPPFWT